MNYTGLRKGDSDYEGYISKGDLNMNGLIDAYDISNVAIVLEDGINDNSIQSVEGTVSVKVGKTVYNAGETIEIKVSGKGLRSVNAYRCLRNERYEKSYIRPSAHKRREISISYVCQFRGKGMS